MYIFNCLVTNILHYIFFLCSAEERKSYRCGTTWGWVSVGQFLQFLNIRTNQTINDRAKLDIFFI